MRCWVADHSFGGIAWMWCQCAFPCLLQCVLQCFEEQFPAKPLAQESLKMQCMRCICSILE